MYCSSQQEVGTQRTPPTSSQHHSSYKSIKWSGWVGRFDTLGKLVSAHRSQRPPPLQTNFPAGINQGRRRLPLCRQCTASVFLGLTNTCCNRNGQHMYLNGKRPPQTLKNQFDLPLFGHFPKNQGFGCMMASFSVSGKHTSNKTYDFLHTVKMNLILSNI